MAARKSKPAYEFVLDVLRKNTGASFAEVKAAADRRGLKIFPIMYGRAKKQLGLIAPKGGRKAAVRKAAGRKAAAAPKAAPARGRGRKAKVTRAPRAAAAGMGDGLDAVIQAMRHNETERERLHSALLKIKAILDAVV